MNKLMLPIINGISAGFVIGVLALLTFDSPLGVWLMFSFGSTALILFVFHDSEFARAKNVFFGHLISIVIGILFYGYIVYFFRFVCWSLCNINDVLKNSSPSCCCQSAYRFIYRCVLRFYFISCDSW